jgi:TonB family protein
MAMSTTQKWLTGCGIGCAALILLVVGLVTSGVLFVRSRFQPLQEASESRKAIVAALGTAESYVPPANGAIAPERMEAFLIVRDALKDAQTRLSQGLDNFDPEQLGRRQQSFGAVLRILNDLSNVIVPIGEYMTRRNQVLLDKRMGLGEYAYIYTIAYHSWLGHPPEEGPTILDRIRMQDRSRAFDENSGLSPDSVRRQYRRVILRLLENQLGGIKEAESSKWRSALKEEIARIDSNIGRVAWQDNLPAAIEESLKPYRGRLLSTYQSSANFFEFLTLDEFNQAQWNGRFGAEAGRGRWGGPGQVEENSPQRRDAAAAAGNAEMAGGKYEIVYEVSSGMTAPAPIRQPLPAYTDQARKAQVRGTVTLEATVRKDGTVGNLRILRGLGYGLDESAMDIVANQWKFKPATQAGAPVDVRAKINLRFAPEGR